MSTKNNLQSKECSSGRSQRRSLYVRGCGKPVHWESEKYNKKDGYLSKWAKKKKEGEKK